MTTQAEALKLALEALEMFCEHGAILRPIETRNAIKEALAQPEQICGFDVVLDESMPPDTFKLAQPEQKPVNEGWKLVPVNPTEDMWKAVNNLDDEMAAGNYDGKGCSIEQAWNCLLDAAPTPPPVAEPHKRKPWVSLTDVEISNVIAYTTAGDQPYSHRIARAIEAKLKEKNT